MAERAAILGVMHFSLRPCCTQRRGWSSVRAASPGAPGERGPWSRCGARLRPAADPQPIPAAARLARELPEPRLCFCAFPTCDCVAVPAPLGRRGNRGGREGCAAIDYTAIIAGLIPGLIGFLLVCRAHAGLRISCMKLAFPCFLEYLCRRRDGKCALEPNHFKECSLSFIVCRNRDVPVLHPDALISSAVYFSAHSWSCCCVPLPLRKIRVVGGKERGDQISPF